MTNQEQLKELANAMRKGFEMSKPWEEELVIADMGNIYACALGAACLVTLDRAPSEYPGHLDEDGADPYRELEVKLPILGMFVDHPNGWSDMRLRLMDAIIYCNDDMHEPREKIADWVESLANV